MSHRLAAALAAALLSAGCYIPYTPVPGVPGPHVSVSAGGYYTPRTYDARASSSYHDDTRYDRAAVDSFEWLAANTGGVAYGAPTAADVPVIIRRIFDENIRSGEVVDVAFVIDTTGSMGDDIDEVKRAAHDLTEALTRRASYARMGVVLYKDRGDEYVSTTALEFTDVPFQVHRVISSITVGGGGDLPEHVYAGLLNAIEGLAWNRDAHRLVILMGDAAPHDDYTDGLSRDRVVASARRRGIEIAVYPIIVGR
jgi:Mg-chelatase subunit ChlD